MSEFTRPTPGEWRSAWPHLREKGNEMVGPCPAGCGGDGGGVHKPDADRLYIDLHPPHLFGCRKCPKGDRIAPYRAAFQSGRKPEGRMYRTTPSKPPEPVVEPCVPASAPFTLRDLANAPVWIAVWDKRPVEWRIDGITMGWRYSRPEGVKVARFGGEVENRYGPLELLPWTTAIGVHEVLAEYRQIKAPRQLCLSGDAKTKYSYDVAVIDFDVHAADPPASAMSWRNAVADRLAEARIPVSTSAGGFGFHALLRVDHREWNGKVNLPVDAEAGLALEVIPPGAKAAVALDLLEMARGGKADAPIPRLTKTELHQVLIGGVRREG